MIQWYELRVAGSPGTTTGAAGIKEGIAIGDNGRLCSIASGHAMKFESEQQALDSLGKTTVPGNYRFEAVPCGAPAASQKSATYRPSGPSA